MKKGSGKSIRRLAATFILKQNTTSVSPSRLLILNVSAKPVDRLKPILAKDSPPAKRRARGEIHDRYVVTIVSRQSTPSPPAFG
ncbi:hypothetical protein PLANPX_3610 [Lacipirellula parvula]|uniref:Uncharacterized protein n=1 Tax=Lacipirellula parvula TaxID=2650471 RepID=A0A5K7XBV9_9BACT|nr:hypothetical protein PLANPX_3610 [Lacipirellula parvula]